ncbi:hypothetical protein [uncultured Kriegella sp.]|uniref:hypothetical protein n=1 Tax=uncultured Kriegella sp. TaxID=1798910 RepID=UPI0030DCDFE5|tara:strand:- start:23566 stop:23925 length:360 start_codon:yes stop_codon:yes gene_type:complete
MKKFFALAFISCIVVLGCTDYDDNLSGTQIRVRNNSAVDLTEVYIDSLEYGEVAQKEVTPYQKYDSSDLPEFLRIKADSLELEETVGNFEIDSVMLRLYTFQIDTVSNEAGLKFHILED